MLQEAQKFINKKFKKIDYINTTLPEGYEKINEEYRKVREDIDLLSAVIKNLATYEYGGQIMKSMANWSNVISASSKIKYLKRDDIYTNAGIVGEHMANSVDSSQSFKNISKQFSDAFIKISEEKRKMNEKLNEALTSLSILKKDTKSIDLTRSKTSDLRYDLEYLIQKGHYSETDKKQLQTEYNSNANESLKKMKEFIGDSGISGILTKAVEANKDFAKAMGEYLSKVK